MKALMVALLLAVFPGIALAQEICNNDIHDDGDGHNDRFIPIGYEGTPGLMGVYNRWGQLIFSTRTLAQGWYGGSAPDGTYFYIVTPDEPGSNTLTGHITLV